MPENFESQPFEPERYELREEPRYTFTLTRREFAEVAGAGILISAFALPAAAQRRGGFGGSSDAKLESRLHIGEDGAITIFSGKVEFGQGSRAELAMAAAEEARISLDKVRVVLADTDLTPNDGITAGSRTTPSTVPAVRAAAAAARELLINAAAKEWNADRTKLSVRDGQVRDGEKSLRYANLAAGYKSSQPNAAAVTAPKDWTVLGKPLYRTDGRQIVTGAHQFPSDIRRPGMLYGSVLRAPSYASTLRSADLSAARKMEGVIAVEDGPFIACAAPTSFAARKAVEAIAATAQWDTKDHPSSSELFAYLKRNPRESGGGRQQPSGKGSLETGLSQARHKLRAEYHVPFIQHAPMEPRAAVAEWTSGKLTVWTATQNPFGVRDQLVQAFHLTPANVRVIVPDSGGGFGGKHTADAALEAARIALKAGRPVSLRWTRAEEFMWAYSRPAGVFEIEGGVDASGRLTAWDYTNYNAGTAGMESPYQCANSRTKFVYCNSPLREGSYRGIAATTNNFARECFIEELAAAAGKDPLEFRLANLENARLRDVLTEVAKRFGWRERKSKGKHVGIACGTEKGSYVAACAEIEIVPGQATPKILEMAMVFECGAILNPANLRSQVEGSIIQGLGGALTEEMRFDNGKLRNGSFAQYKVPRFRDVPKLDVFLLDRKDLPSAGAGETPIIAVAPAIANAVFGVNGKSSRSMPCRVA